MAVVFLDLVSLNYKKMLQRVGLPVYCAIQRNEVADQFPKMGASEIQPDKDLSYKERRTRIKSAASLP